jgi:SAM-dependent methyltransferase
MKNFVRKARHFVWLCYSKAPADKIYLRQRVKRMPLLGPAVTAFRIAKGRILQRSPRAYAKMQKREYQKMAGASIPSPGAIDKDNVVGSLSQHDAWPDYEAYLMKYVPREGSWIALEYGCGPGRNIRRWTDWFKRIDGVDISSKNLDNAKVYIKDRVTPEKWPNLYETEGMDCGNAAHNAYDFAFSTICLQHICVHSARLTILKSLFDCLKPGGRLSAQMGFGVPSPYTVSYYEDHVQAIDTNRGCDVAISSPAEVKSDLEKIGFTQFEHWLRPVGPGDLHPQWIFFTAIKPPAHG